MVLIGRNGQGGTESAAPQRTSFLPHCQVHGCIATHMSKCCHLHFKFPYRHREGEQTNMALAHPWAPLLDQPGPTGRPQHLPAPCFTNSGPPFRPGSRPANTEPTYRQSAHLSNQHHRTFISSLAHPFSQNPTTRSSLVTHPSGAGTHHMDMDWPHFQRSGQPRGQA